MKKITSMLFFFVVGAFLMQGFQCASPEMTSAKLAYQNKDYPKAKSFLTKELDRNPKNAEAHIIWAEIAFNDQNFDEATKHINLAESVAVEEKTKNQVQLFKNKIWIQMHDEGADLLNKYGETQAESILDEAINKLTIGKGIKPELPNFSNYLGNAYESKGDTVKAMEQYDDYVKLVRKGIDLAKVKGIYNGMVRTDALKALGNPKSSRGFSTKTDSIIVEKYFLNIASELEKIGQKATYPSTEENELIIFYIGNESKMTVYGWKVDPPKKWLESEREQPTSISTSPLATLSQYYFDKKQYDKSIAYALDVIALEPTNVDANNFLFQIYEVKGDKKSAINYLNQLIEKNPTNKYYRTQYGDYFLKDKDNDKAIEQYNIALKEDPEFAYALINIASAYKNKAKEIQDKIDKEVNANPNYKPNYDEFKSILTKSGEYFERCIKTPKYQNNYQALYELVEIYYVLEKTEQRDRKIQELEYAEAMVDQSERTNYYLKLIKIFDSLVKNPEKLAKYTEKLNAIK